MRTAFRKPLAVVFGVLLVTAGALGSVAFVNDDVRTLDDASTHVSPIGGAAAWNVSLSDAYQGSAKIAYAIGSAAFDSVFGSANTEELAQEDANETRKEIYRQASIQAENNELGSTTLDNYLEDTRSIALMEGKNAYIRALENGANESVATQEAQDAVADYYAVKQKNLLASWNITATVFNSSYQSAENTTNVSADFVTYNGSTNTGMSFDGLEVANVTYTNGTTTQSLEYVFGINYQYAGPVRADVTTGEDYDSHDTGSDSYSGTLRGVDVKPPNSSFDRLNLAYFPDYKDRWNAIQSQNSDVQNEVQSFIDATYSEYQEGDINSSDLVDPYLGAREYAPETSDTWALRALTALGAGSPSNLSNIGEMQVSANNTTYTGVLMSDGTPAGGFVVNETYNASNIDGHQFVAERDGGVVDLNDTFTLESAETTNGTAYESGETIEYREVNYTTANTTEFQELSNELDLLTAEINARQQKLRDSGGGVGWLPDFGGIGGVGIGVVVAAGAAVVLLGRS